MKKILLSLCILGGLATTAFTQNTHVCWPEVSSLSPSEQQSIYNEVKDTFEYKKSFPKELKVLIKPETIMGRSTNQEDPANNNLIIIYQDKKDGLLMHIAKAEGKSYLYARRSKAIAKDITESVPVPNPKANHFPLPTSLIAQLKKEGSLNKFSLIFKILNGNFELSLQMPALNTSKAKSGAYTGKVLDMPVFTFNNIPVVTKDMDMDEVRLREKLGFGFKSITELPNLTLSSSGTDCTGWNYVDPKSETPGQNSFLAPRITSRTIVYNTPTNVLGMAKEAQSILLQAKLDYYKKWQENFHVMMRENGVEPGSDYTKMKGESAEKMTWAVLGNMIDGYTIYMEKLMTRINQSNPKEKPYKLNPGKPNYKPVPQKKDKRVSVIDPLCYRLGKQRLSNHRNNNRACNNDV